MIYINFHNLIGIKIINPTEKVKKFCKSELGYFIQKKKVKTNIQIIFKKKINLPKENTFLTSGFYYDSSDKTFYYKKSNNFLSYNLKYYYKDKIFINIENDFNLWIFLYAIENTLYFLTSRKKICMLHGGAVSKKDKTHIILGPQGSGKTFFVLKKINEGYSFLSDEYIFVNKDANCLSFPRPVNFKFYHKNFYKKAFKYYWNNLKFLSKLKLIFKETLKTLFLRSRWQPMIRLRINKVYPKVLVINKAKINVIHSNYKKNENFNKKVPNLIALQTIIGDIQFEMKNRFYSILNYINKTNDLFIKKVVNDIKKNEKYKIEIIKSFMYKVRNRI